MGGKIRRESGGEFIVCFWLAAVASPAHSGNVSRQSGAEMPTREEHGFSRAVRGDHTGASALEVCFLGAFFRSAPSAAKAARPASAAARLKPCPSRLSRFLCEQGISGLRNIVSRGFTGGTAESHALPVFPWSSERGGRRSPCDTSEEINRPGALARPGILRPPGGPGRGRTSLDRRPHK